MSFSQRDEEQYILKFFEGKIDGMFLDIGAYDGEVFSNTRQLALNGWSGVCVEPSRMVFPKLRELYKDSDKVECVECAIGPYNGHVDFWDSAGAVGTAIEEHYNIWKDSQKDYKLISVPMITFMEFYKQFPYQYDFISIDCEGLDYEVIKSINPDETDTKMFCVEHSYNSSLIGAYLSNYGFKPIYANAENIIATR
jgi:FkbM family methyltransferase